MRKRFLKELAGYNLPFSEPGDVITDAQVEFLPELPTSGQIVWHLPGAPFPYADLRLIPGSAGFNIPPEA